MRSYQRKPCVPDHGSSSRFQSKVWQCLALRHCLVCCSSNLEISWLGGVANKGDNNWRECGSKRKQSQHIQSMPGEDRKVNQHLLLIASLLQPTRSLTSCNSLPASASRAESGLGLIKRHLMTSKMCSIPYFDDQSFLRVDTQISPLE